VQAAGESMLINIHGDFAYNYQKRFILRHQIGKGGFGSVYKVRNINNHNM
jgi:hypothetical protein